MKDVAAFSKMYEDITAENKQLSRAEFNARKNMWREKYRADSAERERDKYHQSADQAATDRDSARRERDVAVKERDFARGERDVAIGERDTARKDADAARNKYKSEYSEQELQKFMNLAKVVLKTMQNNLRKYNSSEYSMIHTRIENIYYDLKRADDVSTPDLQTLKECQSTAYELTKRIRMYERMMHNLNGSITTCEEDPERYASQLSNLAYQYEDDEKQQRDTVEEAFKRATKALLTAKNIYNKYD